MSAKKSLFTTNYITDNGQDRINRDYFSTIEANGYRCWILANGLDANEKISSAKLVVKSISKDFSNRPGMEQSILKKYIYRANKRLLKLGNGDLRAAILVLVSNNNLITWANVGHVRLYHFSQGEIANMSKDQTLARLILKLGGKKISQLNQHPERDNLTQYLGQDLRLKPHFGPQVDLKSNDKLLLTTIGFWEQISNQKINQFADEFKSSEFLEKTKAYISAEQELVNNYTAVFININKNLKFKTKKYLNRILEKKLIILLVIFSLTCSSYIIYDQIKKIKYNREARIVQEEIRLDHLNEVVNQEALADELFRIGKYQKALQEYQKVITGYNDLNNPKKEMELVAKIDELEKLIDN